MNLWLQRSSFLAAFVFSVLASVCTSNQVSAQEEDPPVAASDPADKLADELIAQSKAFSVSMTRDSEGWEAYAAFLHEDYSSWTTSSAVSDREKTVELTRQWWEAGYRMRSSEQEIISVQISGSTGVLRKKFVDISTAPDGNKPDENDEDGYLGVLSKGYATQTWVGGPGKWQLLSATIQVGH